MSTRAIYAGSFDLLTTGHMWMIEQGAELFDELVIGIGFNPAKKAMFDTNARLEMLRTATASVDNIVRIQVFEGYLFHFAEGESASHILRGVRNSEDFEYERVMRNLNGDFQPEIQTVFLVPPRHLAEVSSSIVKGLIGPPGWEVIVKEFVPQNVYERLTDAS